MSNPNKPAEPSPEREQREHWKETAKKWDRETARWRKTIRENQKPSAEPSPEVKQETPITAFVCGRQCPSGEHVWDGPVVRLDNGGSSSCSKCGALSIDVSLWELP